MVCFVVVVGWLLALWFFGGVEYNLRVIQQYYLETSTVSFSAPKNLKKLSFGFHSIL